MKMKDYLYAIPTVLALWFLFHFLFDSFIVPNPIDTFDYIVRNLPSLFLHILGSFKRIGLALIFSVGIGVAIGVLMGVIPKIGKMLAPLVYLFYPIPRVAFLPIILLFFWSGRSVEDYPDYCGFYFLYHDPGP